VAADVVKDTGGWIPFQHGLIGTFSANAEDPVKTRRAVVVGR
jgi:hypothetical protein